MKIESMDDPPAISELVTGLLLLKYCKRVTSRQEKKKFSHSLSLFCQEMRNSRNLQVVERRTKIYLVYASCLMLLQICIVLVAAS